jgi:drug/metabolite transporter (DMT)-like permease
MEGVWHPRTVSRRAWILFALLSAAWGASYMFIKVALDDGVPPASIVFARTALAALVLLPIAARLGALAGVGSRLGAISLLALVQVAAPFMLITLGEQEISSSLAGILVGTAPIFTFLLAFALEGEERASRASLIGVGIGIVGVALLLGVDLGGSAAALLGGLAVVLASFGYAVGAWYLKRNLAEHEPVGIVAATLAATALMVLPLVAFDPPGEAPSFDAAASLVTLGVIGTGFCFVIFYWLIANEGPAKASLVAYVAPGFSVIYGVALLDESFTLATALGLALILGGSWLAAEGRLPRRRGRELAACGIDVAPAGQADRGADAAALESGAEGGDRLARRPAEA